MLSKARKELKLLEQPQTHWSEATAKRIWSTAHASPNQSHTTVQDGVDPYFHVGTDRGRQSAEKARVFADDENIKVAAKLALLVKRMVAEAGKLSRKMPSL